MKVEICQSVLPANYSTPVIDQKKMKLYEFKPLIPIQLLRPDATVHFLKLFIFPQAIYPWSPSTLLFCLRRSLSILHKILSDEQAALATTPEVLSFFATSRHLHQAASIHRITSHSLSTSSPTAPATFNLPSSHLMLTSKLPFTTPGTQPHHKLRHWLFKLNLICCKLYYLTLFLLLLSVLFHYLLLIFPFISITSNNQRLGSMGESDARFCRMNKNLIKVYILW